jgi:hypothetical protein
MTRSSDDADLQMDDVSKAYRSAMHDMLREEPSHAIDDAIRAAARRGVSAGPVALHKSWFSRARFPLAAAATVLLTGSLIFVGMREDKKVITTLNESSSTAVSASLAKADAGIPDVKPVVPPEPYAERKERKDSKENKEAKAKPATPKETRVESVAKDTLRTPNSDSAVAASEPARAGAPAVPFTRTLQAPTAAAAAAPPPPAAVVATAPPDVAITAAQPKPLAAPPPAAAAAESVAQAPAAADNADDVATRARTAPKSQPPVPVMAPASQASGQGAAARNTAVESADRWIGRMVVLQNDGKTEQLHTELRRFRKTYPSTTLPASLQDEWAKIQE